MHSHSSSWFTSNIYIYIYWGPIKQYGALIIFAYFRSVIEVVVEETQQAFGFQWHLVNMWSKSLNRHKTYNHMITILDLRVLNSNLPSLIFCTLWLFMFALIMLVQFWFWALWNRSSHVIYCNLRYKIYI